MGPKDPFCGSLIVDDEANQRVYSHFRTAVDRTGSDGVLCAEGGPRCFNRFSHRGRCHRPSDDLVLLRVEERESARRANLLVGPVRGLLGKLRAEVGVEGFLSERLDGHSVWSAPGDADRGAPEREGREGLFRLASELATRVTHQNASAFQGVCRLSRPVIRRHIRKWL